ncbi:hypothetical protein NA57DRAFT_76558 [Rhizodiscina lignyota]|uniref:Apple domain-containing protein n=1 Tax=Rhizodiscina lignyota TaxID=1504668 RepID=A0A9P4M9F8_9PEZI|nr:hypothetical protein NA57DRAFT_76558 [Rhizodiscina lignyota]
MRVNRAFLAVAGANFVSSVAVNSEALYRRASSDCNPNVFTSPVGLDFDMHCGENQIGWDLHPVGANPGGTLSGNSITDCMNDCATIEPLCYGTVFDVTTGTCWFKNSTFSYQPNIVVQDKNSHLAVPRSSEIEPLDTDCPYKNGSVQSSNDENFTVHCSQDILGADYSPSNAPIIGKPYHATSLSDCMNKCSTSEPLCEGVAFNPGMGNGFANCYPKFNNGKPFSFITNWASSNKPEIRHSAVAKLPSIPFDCKDSQIVNSGNGTAFTLSCNQDRVSSDITNYHDTSLESCIDTCEQYTKTKCEAVIFDTKMTSGFQNCYLKGNIGTPADGREGYIFAMPSSAMKKKSEAWIAGPVVGGVAVLVLLGAGWWYFQRRRKRQAQAQVYASIKPDENNGNQARDAYGNVDYKYQHQQGHQTPQFVPEGAVWQEEHQEPAYELDPEPARQEMPATQTESVELPAHHSPTK